MFRGSSLPTSPAPSSTARALRSMAALMPVLVGVCHGFVGNRMLHQRGTQAENKSGSSRFGGSSGAISAIVPIGAGGSPAGGSPAGAQLGQFRDFFKQPFLATMNAEESGVRFEATVPKSLADPGRGCKL